MFTNATPSKKRWSKEEYLLALDLYFKIKNSSNTSLTASNLDVQKLANKIGRTAGSLSMRLLNFQYLDNGSGLSNGGEECKKIWNDYSKNPQKIAEELQSFSNCTRTCTEQANSDTEIISATIANKIVVALSIKCNNDYGDLFQVLLDLNKLIGKNMWNADTVIEIAKKVHSLPAFSIDQLDSIIKDILPAQPTKEILKIFSIFSYN